ncbi:phosphotransferase [Paenibacillus favisporus]|uniref:phosphotransferase n=1 Tax=Paenibacillus TaxID=44249 RepID=UPI0011A41C50|nr:MULTISPECIES: phosphotransferase [Paenibacillus]MBJ9990574.1 phosphotransferase [Paenibacillus sp. S28]MEC0176829.1 phosphotransferase [Paenibacillus favisporus]
MSEYSTTHVKKIVKQFGIKASAQKRIREGIYQIVTAEGRKYSLKRMPKQIARLRWIDRMLMHVQRNGPLLAWRNPQTPEGRKPHAISQKGELFVLTPWIYGREPSPRSLADMRSCGIALARFHKAGQTALKGEISQSEIGTWYSKLDKRQRYIQNKISKAKTNSFSVPISRFIQRHGPEILRYANQAKALLRSSRYEVYRQSPRQYGVLCHGDGGPSNFIMNDKGTYLIDFETLHVDLRAYDLYRVIYNSSKDYRWDFSIAKAILDGYRKVANLKKMDYELIRVWLRFPFTTYLVLSPFKRIPFTESRLQWALESERRISSFLKKLEEYETRHCSTRGH